ncbi:MAG TPA: PilN domain-containing protein [Candidatus Binatia bacterium]|nr:PilN domain-containing protein [Candidatus Binatia bacterium]
MIRINLAPSGERRRAAIAFRVPSVNLGAVFLVLYLAAGTGLTAWWWSLRTEERRLAADIDAMNRELTTLRAITGQTAQVKAQAAELRQRLQVIEQLTRHQDRPLALLDAFADMVPKDLWITALEEKGMTLTVKGTAFSTTAVADFMQNLRQSGRFKDVDILVARQDLTKPTRQVTFEVTCRYEG